MANRTFFDCKTPPQMKLLNGVRRFVEMAR
jgi:hypothetical protein